MPARTTRRDSWESATLSPPGKGGVDLFTNAAALPDLVLARAENIRLARNVASRRKGAAKVAQIVSTGASKTFGTDGRYALIPAASHLVIPAGGFALRVSFTAVRPSAGNTAYIVSSRPPSQSYHHLRVILSDAGVCTVSWYDSAGNTRSVATSALTADATTHLLAVYDPDAGTFTVYINGASNGTPLTGLASTLKPATEATVVWAIGVEKETSAAVTADTHFDGKVDGLTLFTLRGVNASTTNGTRTFVRTLIDWSRQQWPNPEMDCVLFNYDMDEASLTTLYDSSRFQNHAAVTGTITSTAEVAFLAAPGNGVHRFEAFDGETWNVVEQGGTFAYEKIRAGT